MPRPALQWLSLVGVIWLQSINGTNSNFPAYSSQLKQLLSLSQLQLNNLALASDAGKLFGWFAGIAAIYLPLWLVLVIGSSLGFIGYGMQYLFLTHQISSLSYWHIFLLTGIAGNGICWINTVCYIVIMHNFPSHRQAAVGIATSYLGLSAVIYTAVVNAFSSGPGKRAEEYMLLNSFLPVVISILTAPFVRCVDVGRVKRFEVGFIVIFIITIATGIYAVMSSLGLMSSKSSSPWLKVIGVGVCLIMPLLVPLTEGVGDLLEQKYLINRETRVCNLIIDTDEAAEPERVENRLKEETNIGTDEQTVCALENVEVKYMLVKMNFWLYFLVYVSGATLGLVYLNNLGQIAESRSYGSTSSLVSLASAFVFLGRLLPSILDYAYSRRKHMVPGPAFIVMAMVPMAGAFFLLLNSSNASLHVSTAVIAFSTGTITAISVSTTAELFGLNNFGLNHNVVVANIPLGSFLFGDLAAIIYRKQCDVQERCLGLQCYRMTFIIWGCTCFFGTALALVLYLRTRKLYLRR